MFAYAGSHPDIKTSAYFDYKAQQDSSTAGHVFLDNGAVNYAPAAHDFDHRLVAQSGADFQGTFTRGVADYLTSAEVVDAAPPSVPTIDVQVRHRTVTLRVSGDGITFEAQLRREAGSWHEAHTGRLSLAPGHYTVRARASNSAGSSPWSAPKSFTVR